MEDTIISLVMTILLEPIQIDEIGKMEITMDIDCSFINSLFELYRFVENKQSII